jgi:hypothetical protein
MSRLGAADECVRSLIVSTFLMLDGSCRPPGADRQSAFAIASDLQTDVRLTDTDLPCCAA